MDPQKRWLNGAGYKANKKFWNDIQKYGWNSFDHKVLANGLSQEEAVSMEEELIREFDTVSTGYNNSPGGRYGKSGLLSHECHIVLNALKKHRNDTPKHEWMYQIFKMANEQENQDIYNRLNLYMPTVARNMAAMGYPLRHIEDELVLANYIHEFSYLFAVEAAVRNKTEIPPYKSYSECLAVFWDSVFDVVKEGRSDADR